MCEQKELQYSAYEVIMQVETLECTKFFQNFTCFKKLCFASYSKVSTISASQFDMQCLKIPNKVYEYIMQIELKG